MKGKDGDKRLIGSRALSSFSYQYYYYYSPTIFFFYFIIYLLFRQLPYYLLLLLFFIPLSSAWFLHYCISFSYLILICFILAESLSEIISLPSQGRERLHIHHPSQTLVGLHCECCGSIKIFNKLVVKKNFGKLISRLAMKRSAFLTSCPKPSLHLGS